MPEQQSAFQDCLDLNFGTLLKCAGGILTHNSLTLNRTPGDNRGAMVRQDRHLGFSIGLLC